jgi:hypothetical protein
VSDENFFSDLVPAEKPAAPEESTGGGGYFDELKTGGNRKRSRRWVQAGKEDAFIEAGIKHDVELNFSWPCECLKQATVTLHALRAYKNPGGLMDPRLRDARGFKTFDSIDEGIGDSMANTSPAQLYRQGLTTIAQVGAKYSPQGSNDPNRTNAEWPSAVALMPETFQP